MPTENLTVSLGGAQIPTEEVFEIIVDQDVDQPDMAFVTLNNIKGERSSKVTPFDPFVVSTADGPIFQGEIIGMEPTFDHTQPARIQVRGLNKMHKLARGGRKTKTFEQMTDQDIVTQVCQDAGLTADCDSDPKFKYDHVFQHNMTNLEFIRQRAARLGFGIKVNDTTLEFKKRKVEDCGVKAVWGGGEGILDKFKPRMSMGAQISKVICRGWDPIKRKEVVGEASPSAEFGGTAGSSKIGDAEYYVTDRPIFTKDEADAVAKAVLRQRMMAFVQGEAQFHGSPKIQAGKSLEIDCNDPRFNGKYFISGCRHRYVHTTMGVPGQAHDEAGYRTLVRIQRDATF